MEHGCNGREWCIKGNKSGYVVQCEKKESKVKDFAAFAPLILATYHHALVFAIF